MENAINAEYQIYPNIEYHYYLVPTIRKDKYSSNNLCQHFHWSRSPNTDLNVDVHLLLLVAVDHGPVLDDEPVLGALQVDGHLLDRGDHDNGDKGVALTL